MQRTPVKLRANPVYSQMVAELRDSIVSGRLNDGDRLAGELGLSRDYGISVTSVRSGVEILVREGLLTRRRGSGTYVRCHSARPVRNTVAFLQHVHVQTYHPYYSELQAGFRAGLEREGLRLWEPQAAASSAPQDFGNAPYNWNLEQLWAEVDRHAELAGVLARPSLMPTGVDWEKLPLVMPDVQDRFSYVAYSWERELETCFRHLLEEGARRIWALSVFPESMLRDAAKRAAAALAVAEPQVILRQTSDQVSTLSECIQAGYNRAHADFIDAPLDVDGVLVSSDFEAQGVVDVLAKAGSSSAGVLKPLIAIVNKESGLRLPSGAARLVLDAYEQGVTLAAMLHAMIKNRPAAARRVTLSGRLEVA